MDPPADLRAIDERWMQLALEEARAAWEDEDEVPIGAVLVAPASALPTKLRGWCAPGLPGEHGLVMGRAHNRTRSRCDPTAHAEILAIRAAARRLGYLRLPGCALYTTVEPCFMCAGAIVHARLARVVWSVRDPKFGGAVSLGNVLAHPDANHRVEWTEGVGAEESRELLQAFFRQKRRPGP
jgi:tRNA(adenine34) deaminase